MIGLIERLIIHPAERQIFLAYSWADRHTAGFAAVIWHSIDNFAKHGVREAAALSYYALFSLFPLLMMIVVIIGWVVGPTAIGSTLNDFLTLFLPGATATELSRTIERFVSQGVSASIVALVGLSWSAVSLFSNLEGALSRTFRDPKFRPFLARRIAGLAMIAALGALLIANIVTSLLFSFFDLLFLNRNNIWLSMASIFIPFGFSMGIFAMMYRWIPRTKVGWDAIWPAALMGGAAWEIAKRLFGWYLDSVSNLSLVYGSITTIIIFMLWAYYTSCILLLFAEFCVRLYDWQVQRRRRRAFIEQEIEFAGDYYDRMLAVDPSDSIP